MQAVILKNKKGGVSSSFNKDDVVLCVKVKRGRVTKHVHVLVEHAQTKYINGVVVNNGIVTETITFNKTEAIDAMLIPECTIYYIGKYDN